MNQIAQNPFSGLVSDASRNLGHKKIKKTKNRARVIFLSLTNELQLVDKITNLMTIIRVK